MPADTTQTGSQPEFHGASITSDGGRLAYRGLDDSVDLTAMGASAVAEGRRGKTIRHRLRGLLRRAVWGRPAGYEDGNDAARLARKPAMCAIVGRQGLDRAAAPPSPQVPPAGARRFLLVFAATVLAGFAVVAGAMLLLWREGLLPPPPLTATGCIDSKFAALRSLPLGDRTLVAVGSSVTWRNLDMAVLERRFPGTRAYNAAPCWLYADQMAFYARFILERMPRVKTVVAVVAPRDFEACPTDNTAFFDPHLAHAYVSGYVPWWLPYVTGFRPLQLAREALALHRARVEGETLPDDDAYGSSVLVRPNDWRPPLEIDPRCYAGLSALEEAVAARGARLVVATVPIMPEWAAANDPDGWAVAQWTSRVAAALRREDSLLVDGRALGWDDSRFADAVHLLYPHHRPFTEFLADAMARRAPPPAEPATAAAAPPGAGG